MKLLEIHWPVYLLSKDKPSTSDNIVFYLKETYSENEEGDIISQTIVEIVDDLNITYDTLALRRLHLKENGVPLFKLKKALFFLGDLIKVVKPSQWMIDSSGRIFNHTKSTRVSLVCKRITNVFPLGAGGAIIEVEYSNRFKVLHSPDPKLKWAGILTHEYQQILYGMYEEPFKDTWRLI